MWIFQTAHICAGICAASQSGSGERPFIQRGMPCNMYTFITFIAVCNKYQNSTKILGNLQDLTLDKMSVSEEIGTGKLGLWDDELELIVAQPGEKPHCLQNPHKLLHRVTSTLVMPLLHSQMCMQIVLIDIPVQC